MQEVRELPQGAYFTVPDSENVYQVTRRFEDDDFVPARIICKHSLDAAATLVLPRTTQVSPLSEEEEHREHPSWTAHEQQYKREGRFQRMASYIILPIPMLIFGGFIWMMASQYNGGFLTTLLLLCPVALGLGIMVLGVMKAKTRKKQFWLQLLGATVAVCGLLLSFLFFENGQNMF